MSSIDVGDARPVHPEGGLSYLSPTSFMMWRENPIGFWMRYLAPPALKMPRTPQTPQMAVGNVFDVHMKYHLAQTVGRHDLPPDVLERSIDPCYLGRGGSLEKVDQLVLYEGLRAYHAYKDSPALRLLLEGVTNIEVPAETVRVTGGVPIWGKPDAELFRNGRRVVQDWKVGGAFNTRTPTSEPGWAYRFVERVEGGNAVWVDEGPHHRSIEYLENLNERWAIQLAMYSWLLGDAPGSDIEGQIDKILLPDPKTVEVYVYRCRVSRDFQLRILSEMQLCWQKVVAGEVLPPELRDAPPELLLAMVD